jgi:hypothetical protein
MYRRFSYIRVLQTVEPLLGLRPRQGIRLRRFAPCLMQRKERKKKKEIHSPQT